MAIIDRNTVKSDNQLGKSPNVTFEYSENKGKRIMFVGNSITRHGPKPDIGWENDWGMAASSKENDYVHRTIASVLNTTPDASFCICQAAVWEQNYKNGEEKFHLYAPASDFEADIIVFRLIENCPRSDFDEQIFYNEYSKLISFFNKHMKAKIIITSGFWKHPGDAMLQKFAEDNNFDFIYLGDLGEQQIMRADGLFSHTGVAAHPGDLGMENISNRIYDKIEKYLG